MLLGGNTFLLATILGNLREQGIRVQESLGVRPFIPAPPLTGKIFTAVMMMGVMVLIATFIISIWLATVAAGYWNHSIANELNPAGANSVLLGQLALIHSVKAWLVPLKFVGMAVLFTGIALVSVTIVQVLRAQTRRLQELLVPVE